jgi:taurine transport system substrate-binding protein
MKRTNFSVLTVFAIVMLLLSVSAIAGAQDGELEVTEISLGFGVDPVFAPHIIAIEMGWFEEAGFTSVDTATFTAGALAGEALAAGEIELWTPGNVPPISMRHNGMPIVIVGTNTLAYIEKFVARTDATLESPEDLLNIRIGLLEGSTASAVVENIALQYDLDPLDLQIVNLPPPEQLTSIINDDIQAFVVWNPWPYVAQQDEAVDVEILHTGTESNFAWDMDGEYQTSFTRSVWVMSEEFIQENPNSAAAMMEVMHRAQDYVNDPENQEEVIEIVATFLDQPVEQVEALWGDYTFESVFDEVYVQDMQNYTDFLFDAGRIDDPQDPMSYTYTGFMEAHNPDNVIVEGTWEP